MVVPKNLAAGTAQYTATNAESENHKFPGFPRHKAHYGCHHRQATTTITVKLPVEWKVIGKEKTKEEKGGKKSTDGEKQKEKTHIDCVALKKGCS